MSKEKFSGMQAFISMMAAAIPFEDQISDLEEKIQEYKLNPSSENRKRISAHCFLIINSDMVEENGGGIDGALKFNERIETLRRKVDFFETKDNQN